MASGIINQRGQNDGKKVDLMSKHFKNQNVFIMKIRFTVNGRAGLESSLPDFLSVFGTAPSSLFLPLFTLMGKPGSIIF